jgi:diguanylate cyclase (GGDEF)-like protein/PAS domain S-box-containing protein
MNLSIKVYSILVGATLLVLFSTMFFISHKTSQLSLSVGAMNERENSTLEAVQTLQKSISFQSEFAKSYVATGIESYRKLYYRVLNIRDGLSERPENYSYFSFVEEQKGVKISYENLLHKTGIDKNGLDSLQRTIKRADELREIQVTAFGAMDGIYRDSDGEFKIYGESNQEFAIELLFSEESETIFRSSLELIEEVLSSQHSRFTKKREKLLKRLNRYRWLFYISSILTLIYIVILFISIHKKFIFPITSLTDYITLFKRNRGERGEAPIIYSDEIGGLTTQFNSMKKSIQTDLSRFREKEIELGEYISLVDQNIITSTTDLSGVITYVSNAFIEISGYSREELIGRKHSLIRHPDMSGQVFSQLWRDISADRSWRGEVKNRRKNGDYYWVKATIYPNYNMRGEKIGYTSIRVDITAEKRVEMLLKQAKVQEFQISQYVNLINQSVITSKTDLKGVITYSSEAFQKISGYSSEELLGEKHSIVRHRDTSIDLYRDMWDHLSQNRNWSGELKNRAKDGSIYWVYSTIYPLFDSDGEKIGYTAVNSDITDRKRVERLMEIDPLTEIRNRSSFNSLLPRLINISRRDRLYLSMAMIDIDHFKLYNDTYGHQAGDTALKRVANILTRSPRDRDIEEYYQFRLGGEEFAIVTLSADVESPLKYLKFIRESVEKLDIEHKSSTSSSVVTVSIGLLVVSYRDIKSESKIYRDSDELLYKAKKGGRNQITYKLSSEEN